MLKSISEEASEPEVLTWKVLPGANMKDQLVISGEVMGTDFLWDKGSSGAEDMLRLDDG